MKYIRTYEDFEEQSGFISVPPDFEKRLKDFAEDSKQKSQVYEIPYNQIKIDLFYGLKDEIRNFLDDAKQGWFEKTQEEYERRLNREIDGILYKFSEGKYTNISLDDKQKVKDILWNLINERIPYNEVDYYYTYDLRGKLLDLLEEFVNEIKKENLFITD